MGRFWWWLPAGHHEYTPASQVLPHLSCFLWSVAGDLRSQSSGLWRRLQAAGRPGLREWTVSSFLSKLSEVQGLDLRMRTEVSEINRVMSKITHSPQIQSRKPRAASIRGVVRGLHAPCLTRARPLARRILLLQLTHNRLVASEFPDTSL